MKSSVHLVGQISAAIAGITVCALMTLDAHASPLRVDELVRNALQLDQDKGRGKRAYAEHCAACHGPHDDGTVND